MGYIRRMSIEAPVERVFRSFTDAKSLQRWLAPGAHVEPIPGGRWEHHWYEGEPRSTVGCRLLEVRPNALLRFEWTAGGESFDDLFADGRSRPVVEVRFAKRAQGTDVAVEMRETREGSGWAAYEEVAAEDWEEALLALKSFCEEEAPAWGPPASSSRPPPPH